jgi:hypothetical protein
LGDDLVIRKYDDSLHSRFFANSFVTPIQDGQSARIGRVKHTENRRCRSLLRFLLVWLSPALFDFEKECCECALGCGDLFVPVYFPGRYYYLKTMRTIYIADCSDITNLPIVRFNRAKHLRFHVDVELLRVRFMTCKSNVMINLSTR